MLLATAAQATLPVYDHIVVVWEENKDYGDVIGASDAPYINKTLLTAYHGVSFTQFRSEFHPSEPNYLCLSSGSNQGVTDDGNYAGTMTTPNLFSALISAGKTFDSYSEDLPSVGYTGSWSSGYGYEGGPYSNAYAERHNPFVNWQGSGPNQLSASCNMPFTSFPSPGNYASSPTVSFVIPNEYHEMHSGSVSDGDTWLSQNMDAYARWALTNNSLLIVTWDENDGSDPATGTPIPTIMVGAHLNAGNDSESINHYNLLHTIESMYGLGDCTSNDANAPVIASAFAPAPSTVALWASAISGSWSNARNWTGGIPNGIATGAVINASTTATLTITLDAPVTLGTLLLGAGTPGVGYTLSGSGSNMLTFSNTSNNTAATITVVDGSHVIDAPVVLADNLVMAGGGANSWTLSFGTASSITDNGAGRSLTLSGIGGTLILSGSDNYTGGTILTAGTLVVTSRTALPAGSSLTVGGTYIFDPSQAVSSGSVSSGAAAVPEPTTSALLGVGALGLLGCAWRKRRSS
ncbi:MAG: alkaline phosphatase family protein [Thermoguttaceae bacterium]